MTKLARWYIADNNTIGFNYNTVNLLSYLLLGLVDNIWLSADIISLPGRVLLLLESQVGFVIIRHESRFGWGNCWLGFLEEAGGLKLGAIGSWTGCVGWGLSCSLLSFSSIKQDFKSNKYWLGIGIRLFYNFSTSLIIILLTLCITVI